MYLLQVRGEYIRLQPGYEAIRLIRIGDGQHQVRCRIEKGDTGPKYTISCSDPEFSVEDAVMTMVVRKCFERLGYEPKKRPSGLTFFGVDAPDQLRA